MQDRPPQDDAVLLPNNEVQFRSLSRKAKVKPAYFPRLKEPYQCHAAAEFAAAYYRDTGRALLHDAVKKILHKKRAESLKKGRAKRDRAVPSFRTSLPFYQSELCL